MFVAGMPVNLTVNGRAVSLDAEDEMPLLWALRDLLELHGTRFACGVGACRACTVLVDGAPTTSCTLPLRAVAGRRVDTVEQPPDAAMRAVQQAWLEEGVPQCGYCQSGQLVAAAALLRRAAAPSDAEIDAALGAHLCRCGTYGRIRAGVHRAARALRGGVR